MDRNFHSWILTVDLERAFADENSPSAPDLPYYSHQDTKESWSNRLANRTSNRIANGGENGGIQRGRRLSNPMAHPKGMEYGAGTIQ